MHKKIKDYIASICIKKADISFYNVGVMVFLSLLSIKTLHAIQPITESIKPAKSPVIQDPNKKKSSDTKDVMFINNLVSSIDPKKQLQPVLVNEGEGALERDPDNVPENIATKLIKEPEQPLPLVLVHEDDEKDTHKYGDASITVLIPEVEKPAPTLLINKTEDPKKTIMYLEPEFDPPAVVYLENEQELSAEVNERKKQLLTTRLIAEPDPDEAPSKTAICFGQEVIELPSTTCHKKDKHKKHLKHKGKNKKNQKNKNQKNKSTRILDDTGFDQNTKQDE